MYTRMRDACFIAAAGRDATAPGDGSRRGFSSTTVRVRGVVSRWRGGNEDDEEQRPAYARRRGAAYGT
jgi:hypothetical protein